LDPIFQFFPANSDGDDIQVYADESRSEVAYTLHNLRQQDKKKNTAQPNYCLSDYIAPKDSSIADYIGGFAVTTGHKIDDKIAEFEADNDDYQSIMLKVLPAPGYPACPDHTEKATLWDMLEPEPNAGMTITESFAMLPTAAVSGWYFAHPDARYFSVTRIQQDQVIDYAERKGMDMMSTERWLAPILGYDV